MCEILYAAAFVRMYKKLPQPLKEEVKDKIELFKKEENHPALKVHKLSGRLKGRYAFSVNYKIRIVFRFGRDKRGKKTALLLYVGSHDNVY